MSEAPKKIWYDLDDCSAGPVQFSKDDPNEIPYIRADIVDELAEALKDAKCWRSRGVHRFSIVPKIEAALAKLEESHEI